MMRLGMKSNLRRLFHPIYIWEYTEVGMADYREPG